MNDEALSSLARGGLVMQRRGVNARRRVEVSARASAGRLIGRLEPGGELHCLTNGQFSMIDILHHVLNETGPADVDISTWTMGIYDAEQSAAFCVERRIRTIRWVVDPSMFGRRPALSGPLVKAFGADAFRSANIHAKFAVVRNEAWNIVIRSSMNLNRNDRIEHFDLSDDARLAGFYVGMVDAIWSETRPDEVSQSKALFERLMDGIETVETGVITKGDGAEQKARALARLTARRRAMGVE